MSLYFVIGSPGAGKSAACAELRRRGFVAYDTDLDALSVWFDDSSNAIVPLPVDPRQRDDRWLAQHTLRLPPETVLRIAAEVGDSVGFICGSTGNEGEIWELFEGVVSLSVSAAVLRQRLTDRNTFGSTEDELRRVLVSHQSVDADNARFGAHLVNADRPTALVVDELLRVLKLV